MTDAQKKIDIQRERLEVLETEQASRGPITPPAITMEIRQLRTEIATWQYQRTQILLNAQGFDAQPPRPAKGLILLVSPRRANEPLDSLSAYQSMYYHQPMLTHCWLIATTDTGGSQQTAEVLAQYFSKRVVCQVLRVANGVGAAEVLTKVNWIYTHALTRIGLEENEVIADISGATKPLTAGMVLACGTTRAMQYMLFQKKGPSLPVLLRV